MTSHLGRSLRHGELRPAGCGRERENRVVSGAVAVIDGGKALAKLDALVAYSQKLAQETVVHRLCHKARASFSAAWKALAVRSSCASV